MCDVVRDDDMVFCRARRSNPMILTLSNFCDPRPNSEK